jgi:hypothetical protein
VLEKEGLGVEREAVNAYDQLASARKAGLGGPYVLIAYMSDGGRGGLGQYWAVDCPGRVLDKDSHWGLHGKKGFWLHTHEGEGLSGRKAQALAAAQGWVAERFGEVAWARNAVGDYVPAHINKAFPVAKRARQHGG